MHKQYTYCFSSNDTAIALKIDKIMQREQTVPYGVTRSLDRTPDSNKKTY